jgi:hypothetical protein
MNALNSLATSHPALFVLGFASVWFVVGGNPLPLNNAL